MIPLEQGDGPVPDPVQFKLLLLHSSSFRGFIHSELLMQPVRNGGDLFGSRRNQAE